MKVCHLTSVHNFSDTRIFVKQCCFLADYGYEVYLIAPNVPKSELNGVNLSGLENNSKNRFLRMFNTTREVYKKALQIDAEVYHFHDPELIPVGLKLKKKGKKVIYDVHEDVPRQILSKVWIPAMFRKLISVLFELYENKAAKKFDFIVTATPYIKKRFENKECNTNDINNFPILEELKVEGVSWSEKKNQICYVGGLNKVRGIFELLDSIDLTEIENLILAGDFTSKEDFDKALKMKSWDKVKYLGFQNREGVKNIYRFSKAGVVTLHPIPNYLDALPVKMFEYMAAGIPVISSNFPLWREIIEENSCGICVDPLNSNDIAEAIDWIKNNPNEAEIMGKNGRIAVETKYNWEKEFAKLVEIYKNL